MAGAKGEFGYVSEEKKKRILRTICFFLLPAAVFSVGMILNGGDRNNIYSVIAAVGCIPGCISAVTMIMMLMRRPVAKVLYDEISQACGKQTLAYEVYLTTENSSLFLDAVLISGDVVTGYCDGKPLKDDISIVSAHVRDALKAENYECVVKIFDKSQKENFLRRIEDGAQAYDKRDHSREQGIKNIILSLAL